jgi:hypothetical protein
MAAGVALLALAFIAAGRMDVSLGPLRFAPGTWPASAVCGAAALGLVVGLILAILVSPNVGTAAAPNSARPSYIDLIIRLAMLWPVTVIPLAAFTGQAWLIPASLSLPVLLAALGVAQHTAGQLQQGKRLEVRHDIVGLGSGIGAWRMSSPAASALLAVLLLAGAVALATAGLPHDTGKTQDQPKTEDPGSIEAKKTDKPSPFGEKK